MKISIVPYLLVKLTIKNKNQERLTNISGVLYVNDENVGIALSKVGVMLRYVPKGYVKSYNRVSMDIADPELKYYGVVKNYTTSSNYIEDTVLLD